MGVIPSWVCRFFYTRKSLVSYIGDFRLGSADFSYGSHSVLGLPIFLHEQVSSIRFFRVIPGYSAIVPKKHADVRHVSVSERLGLVERGKKKRCSRAQEAAAATHQPVTRHHVSSHPLSHALILVLSVMAGACYFTFLWCPICSFRGHEANTSCLQHIGTRCRSPFSHHGTTALVAGSFFVLGLF